MVLEMPAPDSGSDFYASGTAEHSSSPNPPGPFAKYPTKVTLPPYNLLKFLGFWSQARYERDMTARLVNALDIPTALVSRFPTQEETDAFIDAQNRRANTQFLADLVMAAGVVAVSQLIRQYAHRTHMSVGPAQIRLPSSMRVRGLLFIPPVAWVGYGLGKTTSDAFGAVRLAGDQRLRGYYTELKKQSPQALQRKMKEYMVQRAKEQAERNGSGYVETEQVYSSGGGGGGMDDASPTGGAYASEYGQQSTIVSMAQQQQQEEQRRQLYKAQQQQQQQQPADQGQGQSFFDDDDASPVARPVGGWQQQRQQQQQSQQASGSAWARIRQSSGAGSKPGPFEQSPQQLQQQWGQAEQTGADSYSYQTQSPQSDKELAQREFDRMLEQERQLGTGVADGNEEKRGGWRRW